MASRRKDSTLNSVTSGMRSYWEERARENAVWYVDTTTNYESPDMDQFFATGREVVRHLFIDAPIQPRGRDLAVEIGCGLGRICLALSDHFAEVVGVDISESMINQARELVPNSNVRFEVVSGADLGSIDDKSADLVTTFTVFQHMPEASPIEAYIRDAARVLRPGGVLAAQWNNLPHPMLGKAQGIWWRLRHRIGGPLKLDARVAPQFVGMRLPEDEMLAIIRRAGLTVHGTTQTGTLFAWVWATKD